MTRAGMDTLLRGYSRATAPERAGFGMLGSFTVTIGVARAINYVRERRRPAPLLRSWVRRTWHAPREQRVRIHHFLPGVALAFFSGAAAILKREDRRELWFSVPFGVGAGLTCDEIALLAELDNPYWGSESLATTQAALAGVGALALSARFIIAGRSESARAPSRAPAASGDRATGDP